jgi:hypothetical protein
MPHGLNCSQVIVQLGTGTHHGEQASLHLTVVHLLSRNQGLTLNTRFHRLIIAAMQGNSEGTWSPTHLSI